MLFFLFLFSSNIDRLMTVAPPELIVIEICGPQVVTYQVITIFRTRGLLSTVCYLGENENDQTIVSGYKPSRSLRSLKFEKASYTVMYQAVAICFIMFCGI